MSTMSTGDLIRNVLQMEYFQPEAGFDEPAIPAFWRPGTSPLVVVVGENASGKSFFRRLVQQTCYLATPKIAGIGVSMEGRLRDSGNVLASIAVYGNERDQSTGYLSARTVTMGIKTCRAREEPHVIFWDEPDIGLSDSYAAGVGATICAFAGSPPAHTTAAFVVTHRRALVRELLPAEPHYIHLGEASPPPNLRAWLDAPPGVARAIEELSAASRARTSRIGAVSNRRAAARTRETKGKP